VQFTRDAEFCFLRKKWAVSFRKELRDSKRCSSSVDDVYKPTLWYFDLFLFTADQVNPRKSKSIHLVLSTLLQLASMNWILKCTRKVGSLLMRVW
jgi:hypothetical protein